MTTAVFQYEREPAPEWVDLLAQVSPATDALSHLRLVWHSGTPDLPQQRWVLYECIPVAKAREIAFYQPGGKLDVWLIEAEGPHPDTLSVNQQTLLTGMQWELYRNTGHLCAPYWVIQGERGGHKVEFDRTEVKLLKMAKRPFEPPPIGAMPYAPFDQRVVKQIVRGDKLAQVKGSLTEFKRRASVEGSKQVQADAEREFRAQYLSWLEEQVGAEAEELAFMIGRADSTVNLPKTTRDVDAEADISTARWVETGRLS